MWSTFHREAKWNKSHTFLKYKGITPQIIGGENMEYTALYRKFRPRRFDEIVGQEHIIKTIKNEIINDRVI